MVKKTLTKISGARFLSSGGSLVFCDRCGIIIGSVNRYGYKYLYITFDCNCGNHGEIKIIRDGHLNDQENPIYKAPKTRLGTFVCTKCDTPLISIIKGRVQYSYYIECICGEKYDSQPSFDKRLGETLKAFKKQKNKERND